MSCGTEYGLTLSKSDLTVILSRCLTTPHHAHNSDAAARLDAVWLALTGGHTGAPATIPVMMGRSLRVPRACNGACRFVFADLCQADVFAADYHAVCAHFHTLVLEGVPRLSTEARVCMMMIRGGVGE